MEKLGKGIGNANRYRVLEALMNGPATVGVVVRRVKLSQPAVSQHLRVLKDADLVSERREGRQRIYRLHPMPLKEVVSWIDEFEVFFNARLDALADHLDRKHGRKKK